MGSLSSPSLIKDVYKTLAFRKSDNKLYRDDGTDDIELLDLNLLDNFASGERLVYTSSSLTSGDIFTLNNVSTELFSIDYQGVLKLKTQASAPSAVTGGVYFSGSQVYIGIE